ncbi:hypothetical protein, partial [Bacillus altitudinis]|uniref:hypothetical protein n=1 Tax=Bacillus altitudinis TaxID=293387 RepID=UPI003670811C
AVGRAPDPRHRPRLIERKKGWVAGNVCWVIPDENEHGATFEDLTGFVFGQYTVIGPHKHTSTGTRWWARCSCSKEFWISTSRLRKLENPKCKSCAARERTEKFRLRGLNPNGKPFAIKKPRERKIKEKKEKVTGISLSQTMEYLRWMQIKRSAQQATEAVRTRRIYGPDIVASFSTFLEAVGKCPDGCAVIRLKDKKIGYVSGNMYWGPK